MSAESNRIGLASLASLYSAWNASAESRRVDHRIASGLTGLNHLLDQPEQNGGSVPKAVLRLIGKLTFNAW